MPQLALAVLEISLPNRPSWHPDEIAKRQPMLRMRNRIRNAIRICLEDRGLTEVETPALQFSPGLEPNLTAFATDLVGAGKGHTRRLYLHTSPEFAMKKLLVGGAGSIYQFARTFRNAERSSTHHPEFTMLEWYRTGKGYQALIEDCGALLRAVAQASEIDCFRWQGQDAMPGPLEILTVADAFSQYTGLDLMKSIPVPSQPDVTALVAMAHSIGIRTSSDDDWDDVFFRIFLDRIESHLGHPRPTILIDYPIHMAALARPKPEDERFAERFELYICGLELANAFGELTDPKEQRRRFERDRKIRKRRLGEAYPMDEDFLKALEFGLPESAGIALGFDRLVMLATGATQIEDVLWLPVVD